MCASAGAALAHGIHATPVDGHDHRGALAIVAIVVLAIARAAWLRTRRNR